MRASPPARRVARSADSRPYESAHSLRATVLSGRVVQAERARRVGVSKAQDGLSPWSWSQMPRCDAERQNCTQTGACGTCLRPSAALFRGRCALNCSQRVSNMSHMYNNEPQAELPSIYDKKYFHYYRIFFDTDTCWDMHHYWFPSWFHRKARKALAFTW